MQDQLTPFYSVGLLVSCGDCALFHGRQPNPVISAVAVVYAQVLTTLAMDRQPKVMTLDWQYPSHIIIPKAPTLSSTSRAILPTQQVPSCPRYPTES